MDPENGLKDFRLGELERGLKEMRGDLKEAVGHLRGDMAGLQHQLSSYQAEMVDRFVLRRDYDRAHRALEERLEQVVVKEEQDHTRAWFALAAVGSVGSFVAAILGWFRPLH